LKQYSDHELMLAVKSGATEALAVLFEKYRVRLFNYFLQFSGNRHWAEDMVQETFFRILKYAGSYDEQGRFVPWMFNIARNVAVAGYQREQKQPERDEDSDPELTVTWMSDPQYLQEIESECRKLQLALLKLPAEKRELILLSKLKLLSVSDLAHMYACGPAAIKVRLHRALSMLKRLFESETQCGGKKSHEM